MMPLIDCPVCHDHPEGDCPGCTGLGQVAADFAEKVGAGEFYITSCDHCHTYAVCVLEPDSDMDYLVCAECWIKGQHPRLLAEMESERATNYVAALRRSVGDYSYPDEYRAWARGELARIEAEQVQAVAA
jgi:hypothetical protein